MKILFTQPVSNLGGAERYLVHLLPSLVKKGLKVAFVGVVKKKEKNTAENLLGLLEREGIKVHRIYVGLSYIQPKVFFSINKIIKTESFDALVTQIIYADFWGAIIKKFLNKKVKVFSIKHGYHIETYQDYCLKPENLPRNNYFKIFKFSEKYIDKSFACSPGLNDFHERGGLVKKGQMDIIEHGFNYPETPAKNETYKYGSPQLVILGRIIKLKGHEFVVEILKELSLDYPGIKLVIVGDGIYRSQLEASIHEKGVDSLVKFVGFQKNIMDYLVNSDIVLVPSYTESMPVVILEGFNSKNPVIAFETIGCRDIIDHNETGLLVEAYNTNKLKDAIRFLLDNPSEQRRLAENAYQKLKTHYSLERMTTETIQFFKKYIS